MRMASSLDSSQSAIGVFGVLERRPSALVGCLFGGRSDKTGRPVLSWSPLARLGNIFPFISRIWKFLLVRRSGVSLGIGYNGKKEGRAATRPKLVPTAAHG